MGHTNEKCWGSKKSRVQQNTWHGEILKVRCWIDLSKKKKGNKLDFIEMCNSDLVKVVS